MKTTAPRPAARKPAFSYKMHSEGKARNGVICSVIPKLLQAWLRMMILG